MCQLIDLLVHVQLELNLQRSSVTLGAPVGLCLPAGDERRLPASRCAISPSGVLSGGWNHHPASVFSCKLAALIPDLYAAVRLLHASLLFPSAARLPSTFPPVRHGDASPSAPLAFSIRLRLVFSLFAFCVLSTCQGGISLHY